MQKDMSQIFRKGTKTLTLRISQTTPDLTDSWNPQTYIHTWVQLIACLAAVYSPLQEHQPTELPGPGDRGTWALKVGNPEEQSSPPLHLLSRSLSEKPKVGDKLIYLP